jgi:hypothetical protein
MIDRYGAALELIIRELEESRNSDEDKPHNMHFYLQSHLDSLDLFAEDISSIEYTGKAILPPYSKYHNTGNRKERNAKRLNASDAKKKPNAFRQNGKPSGEMKKQGKESRRRRK